MKPEPGERDARHLRNLFDRVTSVMTADEPAIPRPPADTEPAIDEQTGTLADDTEGSDETIRIPRVSVLHEHDQRDQIHDRAQDQAQDQAQEQVASAAPVGELQPDPAADASTEAQATQTQRRALIEVPEQPEQADSPVLADEPGSLSEMIADAGANSAQLIEAQPKLLRRIFPGRNPVSFILSPSSLLTRRAEDWRHLRSQLKLKLGNGGVLLMASATSREGRSIAAINLSIAFAQEYARVVYIEADFRHPSLHTFFELPQRGGLAHLLQQQTPIDDRIGEEFVPTNIPGLFLLPAGVRSGAPELLDSPRMEAVLTQIKREADWVILDAAPILTYADSLPLAGQADGVVVVALEGHSREDHLARLASRLTESHANVVASVYICRN